MGSIQNKIYSAPGAHQLFVYPGQYISGRGLPETWAIIKKNTK